jgi:transposase
LCGSQDRFLDPIPPEQLLRAQFLQMLYSIRSERLLMEEIDYSMLFRWLWD